MAEETVAVPFGKLDPPEVIEKEMKHAVQVATLSSRIRELERWMFRIKKMLNRDDMIAVFQVAANHGFTLTEDTVREVEAIWAEYNALMMGGGR